MKPVKLARAIAAAAAEKNATDIVAIDVSGLIAYTDIVVVTGARNERMVKAIHDEVHATLKSEHGLLPAHVEGLSEARWVLMDYLDCVLHVMVGEVRDRYRLEALWGEAPRVDLGIQGSGPVSAATG